MFIKNWIKKYKNLIFIFLIIFFSIIWIIILIIYLNKNKVQTEQRVNITEFSKTLEINKEWKLLSYPEIDVLAETEWEIVNIYVTEWDIVDEWQTIMQIWNENNEEVIDSIEKQIWRKYAEFYENMDKYNEFQIQYWSEILDLEKQILEDNIALQIAIDTNDTKTINKIQNEIQELNKKLTILKNERDSLKNNITNIENEINLVNKESIDLYNEFDKQNPIAPFMWIIWNIYVQEWDEINNWDKLFTIINNTYSPEISVWLDFNEYLLTKDLTWVQIITENENRWDLYFKWEIYTRSPILNEEWKYTIIIRILDEVSDLILSDKNTKITVIFTKDFPTIWIPENCFTQLWKSNWNLTLRKWNFIKEEKIWIKNKWENWINIDNLELYSLENEKKKDGIELYDVLCKIN